MSTLGRCFQPRGIFLTQAEVLGLGVVEDQGADGVVSFAAVVYYFWELYR